MSISPLGPILISEYATYSQSNPRQDFNALGKALQSGDLAGAQQAFSNLQQAQQANQPSTNSPTTNPASPISKDFTALGQALSSGDLKDAQAAFAQLKSDLKAGQGAQATQQSAQAVKGHHHHHHHDTAETDPLPPSASTGTTASIPSSSTGAVTPGSVNLIG